MPRNLSVATLLDEVNRYETGSGASQAHRESQLSDLQTTWDEVVAHGDRVSEEGWLWNVHEAEHTVGFNAGNPVTLGIDDPTVRRILSIRQGDEPSGAITLRQVPRLWLHRIAVDLEETGEPRRYAIYGYDPDDDYWQIWLHPFYASSPTTALRILYQGNPPMLIDTEVPLDDIMVPQGLRNVLIWGTLSKRYMLNDRSNKQGRVEARFQKALQDLVFHHNAMKERPDIIRCESEMRYWGLQDDLRYDISRYQLW